MSDERPTVLIVGGLATAPPNYWPMRKRLLRLGAGQVHIAPIWPPDWMLAGLVGFGPLMRRTGNAIVRAYRAGGRRPIIVVGHSAGGIASRLAMAGAPYHGRRAAVAPAVGCLVTLGTPHQLSRIPNRYHHTGHDATDFLDRESPGAFFAPRTSYLTVGSSHPEIAVSGIPGRLIGNFFSIAVGEHTRHAGDGVVPASAVHLEGAQQMTFDDVRHGVTGGPWYGDEPIVNRWWPAALRLWQEALAARSQGTAGAIRPDALELEVAGWSSGSSSGS
ncbi:MAG TPA: hypothetical protein VEX62_05015 [Candidatus Limnocylindrales bacterium]|nr:hypothetical protein [Candidatus Limnocylindrales bacterium]